MIKILSARSLRGISKDFGELVEVLFEGLVFIHESGADLKVFTQGDWSELAFINLCVKPFF